MKTKIKQELHSKTAQELSAMLSDGKKALLTLKLDKAQNKLKNTRSIFFKRKEIAVLATILGMKMTEGVK